MGKLSLKAGVNTEKTTSDKISDVIGVSFSLSGVSLNMEHSEFEGKESNETHSKTELWGNRVTLVVNDKLDLEGAVIDGRVVNVSAKEVLVRTVLDKFESSQSTKGFSVGVMMSWQGASNPQISFN